MTTTKTFTLVLDHQIGSGHCTLHNPCCEFTYTWDFDKNMGSAIMNTLNYGEVSIQMFPLGISGQLDFMSDMRPTNFEVNAACDDSIALIGVVISRVILDMDANGENPSAAIMFGETGDCILASAGFGEASLSKTLPA